MEHKHIPDGKQRIAEYMKTQNYSVIMEMEDKTGNPIDLILAQDKMLPQLNVAAIPANYNLLFPDSVIAKSTPDEIKTLIAKTKRI